MNKIIVEINDCRACPHGAIKTINQDDHVLPVAFDLICGLNKKKVYSNRSGYVLNGNNVIRDRCGVPDQCPVLLKDHNEKK